MRSYCSLMWEFKELLFIQIYRDIILPAKINLKLKEIKILNLKKVYNVYLIL